LIDKTIKRIFKGIDVSEINGKKRHLFASAITPKGVVNYLPSLLATDELIAVTGKPGTGTERLIERVRQCAVERGLYTESYYCALNPYKLEHLVIPELNVSITTRNPNHYTDQQPTMEISFDELLNNSTVENHQQEIRFNQELFEKLLDKAVQTIKNAKKLHDTLESYYIPTMNFSDVQKCQEAILEKLGVIVQGYRSGCEQ
jgi:hypothetical protein